MLYSLFGLPHEEVVQFEMGHYVEGVPREVIDRVGKYITDYYFDFLEFTVCDVPQAHNVWRITVITEKAPEPHVFFVVKHQ